MKRSSFSLIAAVLGVVLLALPAQALAQQQTVIIPPDDDSSRVSSTNTTPILTGALTFGLSYGAAVMVAATTDSSANDRLYVPLIGPWLAIADRPECPVDEQSCDSETTKKVLLGVDGVFQAVGAITLVYGLLTPRSYTRTTVAGQQVEVVPVAMQGGGNGFGLTGSF
ncbi:MAG TPA: hypothetical protein VML75_22675 [Kofleriaceae bacterium]|nr:hypothetical protein [Kofleriaceae bacterium]